MKATVDEMVKDANGLVQDELLKNWQERLE
jgi:hypothetical protein